MNRRTIQTCWRQSHKSQPLGVRFSKGRSPLPTYMSGTINSSTDVDWFKVHTHSTMNSTLKISVTNVDQSLDAKFSLYNSSGVQVGSSVDANGLGGAENGTFSSVTLDSWYFVKVEKGSSGGTGDYRISAHNYNMSFPFGYTVYSDLKDNFDPFTDSDNLEGIVTTTINSSTDVDIYRFKVKEGVHVAIDTISLSSPAISTRIRVSIDEDGALGETFFNLNDGGGFDEGGSHIHIAAPTNAYQDGYMYVYVYPKTAADIGAYTLAIRKGSYAEGLSRIPDVNE